MSYEIIMFLMVVIFSAIGMIGVPWLKNKGLWVITLFAVNIAEQIFNYAKAGEEKFEWVDRLLIQFVPKLTEEQREKLIEELVARLNLVKGE